MNFKTLLLTGLLSLSTLSALPASARWDFTQGDIICDVIGNTLIVDTCRPKTQEERERDAWINQLHQEAFDEVMSDFYDPSDDGPSQGMGGGYENPNPYNQGYSTTIENTGAGMPRVGR